MSSTTVFWRSTHAQQPHDGNSPVREKDAAVSHSHRGWSSFSECRWESWRRFLPEDDGGVLEPRQWSLG